MMRPSAVSFSAVALLVVLCAARADAQSTPVPGWRIGFGVALSNSSGGAIPSFEVPIDITKHLRVQPEFHYQWTNDRESDSMTIGGRTLSETLEETTSSTWFGTSVLYTARQDRLGWHIGGKGGLARTTADERVSGTGITSDSRAAAANGYFIGAVGGGEYFLHERFSVGVAISVVYESADVTLPLTSQGSNSITQTAAERHLQTQAALIGRIYLR